MIERDKRSRGPAELHTEADDEPPLTRREADVAGIGPTPEMVYGDSSYFPNEEDSKDAERADPDEHL
jgi:hypothetical protein